MIDKTTRDKQQHRMAGRQIEALACNIRIAALLDALAVVNRRTR